MKSSAINNISSTLIATAEPLIRIMKANNKSSNHGEGPLFLPMEIMEEIFYWLDAQTLLILKSVCKQWRAMIEDPNFVEKHASLESVLPHYQDEDAPETFKFISSYSGLILETKRVNESEMNYRVRNPTIRRVFDLPNPHENNIIGMVISYAPSSRCYKVVSVHKEKSKINILGIKVLTLGCVDKPSWRSVDASLLQNLCKPDGHVWIFHLKGVVHFCPITWVDAKDFEVVSLDMDNECFTSTMLPKKCFLDSQTKVCAIEYHDHKGLSCLSSAEIVKDELRLLVLEDYKKGKWAEEKIAIPFTFSKSAQPYWASPWDVWFLMNGETQIYSIESEQIINEESPPPGKKEVFNAKFTLETFKGMIPEYEN